MQSITCEGNEDMNKRAYFYFSKPEDSESNEEADRVETDNILDFLKDAVIYYILIDSFASSRRSISRTDGDTDHDNEYADKRYGGTFQGITDNLDYLLKLGINCICIDPLIIVREPDSSEQTGCLRLNPCYGKEADFQFLVDLCHNCGIRVMVDLSLPTEEDTSYQDDIELCKFLTEEYSIDGCLFSERDQAEDNFRSSFRDFFAFGSLDALEFDKAVKARVLPEPTKTPFGYFTDCTLIPRLFTDFGGNQERYQLAVLFQMTFTDVPCIFYGDEQLITNQTKERYTGPMIWSENNESGMFAFYKAAIYLRRKLIALRCGDYRTIRADRNSKLYLYERIQGEQKISISLNAGEELVLLPMEPDNQIIWQRGYTSGQLEGYGFYIAVKQPE